MFRVVRTFLCWYADEAEPEGWKNPINQRSAVINFRLSATERNMLEMICKREGFSNPSEATRALIRESFSMSVK
jgi:hypothetical protein